MQTLPLIILPPVTERASGGTAYSSPVIGAMIYSQMNPPAPAEGRYGISITLPLTLRLS